MEKKIEAMAMLERLISRGMDYSEAEFQVSWKFQVKASTIRKWYDESQK